MIAENSITSCCFDIVSARHVNAQGIIHFGGACAEGCKIPVCQVTGRFTALDLPKLTEALRTLRDPVKLVLEACVEHLRPELTAILGDRLSELDDVRTTQHVLYVGLECYLPGLAKKPGQQVFFYDVQKASLECLDINVFLTRRYHYVQKVKSAKLIGLLVTSTVCYKALQDRVKGLLTRANKACYVMQIGKVTPQKLGNFPEVQLT